MLCELCKQVQATVHLTEIVNDQMTELHLCEGCANQKGAQVESHFGLADLLSGLADFSKPSETEEVSTKSCPTCGMTYEDFRKVGRLGCAACYQTFKRSLGSLLKRIHGSPIHLGKSPTRLVKPAKAKSELAELKRRLGRAIEKEEFEEAARLRDLIRKMEQEQQKPKKAS
ncbi:MAG: UvrB/UvrC motif-containing protein [Candidatus Omnitrophica bacterium]|nr:UvrB/UvrC motif-containing protein [Candidatus Omnitrophota bacterium]MBI2173788.1 UvrB/UvrC motif-containing protein [Candidatus Omnitrophota bacterium]MBI3010250.1 UvrB/UvrC motif-containing protein [Candidatus Omnitrophota bacterium]